MPKQSRRGHVRACTRMRSESASVRLNLKKYHSAVCDKKHFILQGNVREACSKCNQINLIIIFSLKSLFLYVLICLPWHHLYVFDLTFTLMKSTNLLDIVFFSSGIQMIYHLSL